MDDIPCRRFFLEPQQPAHRRYAALRAFFVDGLSPQDVAAQFGSTYQTVRSWVRDFRAQCHAGRLPPFSPSPASADRHRPVASGRQLPPRNRPPRQPLRTSGNWL